MGFTQAIRVCLMDKFITFSGRASRSEYWWFTLFYYLVLFGAGLVLTLFGWALVQNLSRAGADTTLLVFFSLAGIIFFAGLIPQISVLVRRFHDRNLSGWWVLAALIASLVPYVGVLINIVVVILCVGKGTTGENRFGDDPLATATSAEVFS